LDPFLLQQNSTGGYALIGKVRIAGECKFCVNNDFVQLEKVGCFGVELFSFVLNDGTNQRREAHAALIR
jgi:hypothetical protein